MTDRLDSPHDEITEAPPREWVPDGLEDGNGAPTIDPEPAPIDPEPSWLERAGPKGEALTVNAAGGPVSGTFAGLDDTGALLLNDADGRQLSFAFGDVMLAVKDDGA